MDALGNGQLSLEEAAAVSEFEDMPGALDRLMSVAGTAPVRAHGRTAARGARQRTGPSRSGAKVKILQQAALVSQLDRLRLIQSQYLAPSITAVQSMFLSRYAAVAGQYAAKPSA